MKNTKQPVSFMLHSLCSQDTDLTHFFHGSLRFQFLLTLEKYGSFCDLEWQNGAPL